MGILCKSLNQKINLITKEQIKSQEFVQNLLSKDNYVSPQLVETDFYKNGCIETSSLKRNQQTQLDTIMNSLQHERLAFIGPAGSGKTTLLKQLALKIIDRVYLKDVKLLIFLQCSTLKERDEMNSYDLLLQSIKGKITSDEFAEVQEYISTNSHEVAFIIDSLDTLQFTIDRSFENIKPIDTTLPKKHLGNLLAKNYFTGCHLIVSSREYAIRDFTTEIRPDKVIDLVGLSCKRVQEIIQSSLQNDKAHELVKRLKTDYPSIMSLCTSPACLMFTLSGLEDQVCLKSDCVTEIMTQVLVRMIQSSIACGELMKNRFKKLKRLAFTGWKNKRYLFNKQDVETVGLSTTDIAELITHTSMQKHHAINLLHGTTVYFFSHLILQETFSALYVAEMNLEEFEEYVTKEMGKPRNAVVHKVLCGLLLNKNIDIKSSGLLEDVDMERKRLVLENNLKHLLRSKEEAHDIDFMNLCHCLFECGESMKNVVDETLKRLVFHNVTVSASDAHVLGTIIATGSRFSDVEFFKCMLDDELLQILRRCVTKSDTEISAFSIRDNRGINIIGMKAIGDITRECHVHGLSLQDCKISAQQILALNSSIKKINNLILWERKRATPDDILAVVGILPKVVEYLALDLWDVDENGKKILQNELNRIKTPGLKINLYPNGVLETEHISRKRRFIPASEYKHTDIKTDRISKLFSTFCDNIEETSLKISRISLNHDVMDRIATALSKKEKTYLLMLRSCITKDSLQYLLNQLKKMDNIETLEVRGLNIVGNANMGEENLMSLGDWMMLCNTLDLDISRCMLKDSDFEILKKSLSKVKFNVLRCNHSHLSNTAVRIMSEVTCTSSLKELHLVECNLLPEQLMELEVILANTNMLELINLSYNRHMGEKGLSIVASILRKGKIPGVCLMGCNLEKKEVDAFKKSIENSKLKFLDVSYNDELQDEDMPVIGDITVECGVEDLCLRGCQMDSGKLSTLSNFLFSVEMTSIKLSDNPGLGNDGITTAGRISNQCLLKELDLSNCRLSAQHVRKLTQSLKSFKLKKLNIDDKIKVASKDHITEVIKLMYCVKEELSIKYKSIEEDDKARLREAVQISNPNLCLKF